MTPSPARSGRLRRPVKAFGNMVSTNTLSDPEDHGGSDNDTASEDQFLGDESEDEDVPFNEEEEDVDDKQFKRSKGGKKA
ncbi:hypothetical protein Q5752_004532 [Cryptotrichosporon argae]